MPSSVSHEEPWWGGWVLFFVSSVYTECHVRSSGPFKECPRKYSQARRCLTDTVEERRTGCLFGDVMGFVPSYSTVEEKDRRGGGERTEASGGVRQKLGPSLFAAGSCFSWPCVCLQLEVNGKYDVASHLQQNFLLVPFKLKYTHLAGALLHLSPSSVIVFTNTCANARKTALFLRHLGFQSVGLFLWRRRSDPCSLLRRLSSCSRVVPLIRSCPGACPLLS